MNYDIILRENAGVGSWNTHEKITSYLTDGIMRKLDGNTLDYLFFGGMAVRLLPHLWESTARYNDGEPRFVRKY